MRLTIVDGDDWVGLYVGDKLVTEGHQLQLFDVIDQMKLHNTFDVVKIFIESDNLEEYGNFLPSLQQLYDEGWIDE